MPIPTADFAAANPKYMLPPLIIFNTFYFVFFDAEIGDRIHDPSNDADKA